MPKTASIDPFLLDLCIKADESVDIPDLNDDLNRERILAERASQAARFAYSEITDRLGLAFFRPAVITADMFKSEELMNKARRRKEEEEKAAKELERLRKEREQKRFAKKTAAEAKVAKQAEASRQKKEIQQVRQRGSMLKSVGKDEFEVDGKESRDFTDVLLNSNTDKDDVKQRKPKKSAASSKDKKVSSKRKFKDEKYGFGGKKRNAKSNTKDSTEDGMEQFSAKRMKAPFRGSKNRPGKQRRANIKSKKASRK